MVELRPFGAIHVDRRGKVRRELGALVDGDYASLDDDPAAGADPGEVDAICVEYPAEGFAPRLLAACLLRAPLFALGIGIVSLVQWPLYAIVVRDHLPAEVWAARGLAAERDLTVHPVDDHPIAVFADAGSAIVAGNWAALALGLWTAPAAGVVAVGTVLSLFVLGSLVRRVDRRLWIAVAVGAPVGLAGAIVADLLTVPPVVLLGALAALAGVAWTLRHRNDHMVDRVAAVADEEEYDAVALTTGKAHLPGIARAAAERDDVTAPVAHVSKFFRSGRLRTDLDGVGGRPTPEMATAGETLGRRIGALTVDGVVSLIAAVVGGLTAGSAAVGVWPGSPPFGAALAAGAAAGPVVYHVVAEGLWGRSLGKRALGLIVVGDDGEPPGRSATLVRGALRPAEVLPLGLPALASALLSDRNKRIADRLAGTVVVRVAEGDGRPDSDDHASA